MQSSRRHEEYLPVSPSVEIRDQRYDPVHRLSSVSRRDVADLSRKRSSSPRRGLQRDFDGYRRSGSVEGRECGWEIGGGGSSSRTGRVRSRSPPSSYRGILERPRFSEEVVRGKREYVGDMEFDQGEFAVFNDEFQRGEYDGGRNGRVRSRSPPPSYRDVPERPRFKGVVRGEQEYVGAIEFDEHEFAEGEYDGAVGFCSHSRARTMNHYDQDHGICGFSEEMGPPPHRDVPERPHFSEKVVRGKHEYARAMEFHRHEFAGSKEFGKGECDGALEFDPRSKARITHDYDHDHDTRDYGERMVYYDSRILGADEHGMPLQKPIHLEEGNVWGGSYKLHSELSFKPKYRENNVPLSSSSVELGQFEHGSIQYQDSVRLDYIPVKEPHKVGGRCLLHPRDDSYNLVAPSYSKDFESSSSRKMQREHLDPYLGDMSVPPDSYLRDDGRVGETAGNIVYNQKPLKDTGRNYERLQKNNRTCSQWGAYSPGRPDRSDNHHSNQGSSDYHGIPPSDVHRMMPPTARADYDRRDPMRQHVTHPAGEHFEINEPNPGDSRASNVLDHHIKNPFASDHPMLSGTSAPSRHHAEYMSSGYPHAEFERRNPHDHKSMQKSMSHDHQVSHLKSDMHIGRDAELENQEEKHLKILHVNRYGPEVHRLAGRSHVIDEELGLYEPLHRMPKEKYGMEDVSRFNNRNMLLTDYVEPRDFENPYDDEEWDYEDYNYGEMRDLHRHRAAKYRYTRKSREAEISYGWTPSHCSIGHPQRHSTRYLKHDHKYSKPYQKPGSSNWRNSYLANRKGGINKDQNAWKRNDDLYEDETVDGDLLENWDNTVTSDPQEDSEEFKRLVHEAFLSYTKRLNAGPYIRGRYTEQGKAGTLFCIVCQRSCSKEFMDARRLAMHAFMSHKPGLRVEHLGLHKAICVLMGWDSDSPPETVTWAPQVLSSSEALSQKEDLILWPPLVIIHNVSLLNNNPEEQKLITPELLEDFISGKGLVDGKIKVSLGKPADGSIMVVKFLGTFTGLGNVERLHQYFADNNRGRIDFNSKNGIINTGNSKSAESQGDKVEELNLYGYMGISEDLHMLEFNTKKNISIKSKKDIQDLANAPVRPKDR